MNKKNFYICLVIVTIASFLLGKFHERLVNGYNIKVNFTKEYLFRSEPINLKYVHETKGFAFLDTGKTIIESNYGMKRYFEAQRYFQESIPFVSDLKISGNTILWSDGIDNYELRVNAIATKSN